MAPRRPLLQPAHVVLLYGVVAIPWILLSDTLLFHLQLPGRAKFLLATFKGFGFVVVTGCLLYFLLRAMVRQMARVQAEREGELQESEERFSKAFQSNPEGMTISTVDQGIFLEANPAFLAMMGYTRQQLLGKTSAELGVWTDSATRARLLQCLVESIPVTGFVTSFRQRNGDDIEVELSAERIQLKGRSCWLVITRDVSHQRRLERQFLGAQRMEAIGQLAAGIAHDFRNQLMVIGGSAELLDTSNERNRKSQQQIMSSVEKCESLIRHLLAYSRKQEIRPVVLDLRTPLAEASKMIASMLGRRVETITRLESDWSVHLDPGQLEQLLMNWQLMPVTPCPRVAPSASKRAILYSSPICPRTTA